MPGPRLQKHACLQSRGMTTPADKRGRYLSGLRAGVVVTVAQLPAQAIAPGEQAAIAGHGSRVEGTTRHLHRPSAHQRPCAQSPGQTSTCLLLVNAVQPTGVCPNFSRT